MVCKAIAMKIAIGAPPGTIINGRRAPKLPIPRLCRMAPSPHIRKVALSSDVVTPELK
ncbi:hypothetical protein D3C78_1601510 [compost metagenome]